MQGKIKILCLYLLAALFLCGSSKCMAAEDTAIALAGDHFPPYTYSENGLIKGAAVEIIKEVFLRMKKPFSLELRSLDDASALMEQNHIDALFCIPREVRFEFLLDFVEQPLLERKISFFALKQGYDIPQIKSLDGKRIVMVKNVYYGDQILSSVKNKNIKIKIASDYGEAIDMLIAGKVDLMPADTKVMNIILEQLKRKVTIGPIKPFVSTIKYYIGFSRNKESLAVKKEFSRILSDIKAGGQYDALMEKGLRQA